MIKEFYFGAGMIGLFGIGLIICYIKFWRKNE